MIRTIFISAFAAIAVGLTGWTYSADPAPEPVMRLDSAHWASLINSYTDPTLGLVSRDSARGDSLLRHSGAIGWGSASLSCQDSLRAGSGTMKVWKVTSTANTAAAGTFRAAVDSIDANDNASTCQYIIFPQSGEFEYYDGDAPNNDDLQNWRISGQTAQGNGVNWINGELRARNSDGYAVEYIYSYRHNGGKHSGFTGGDMMNSRKSYFRHISVAFAGGGSGDVQVLYSGGTEAVPQFNDTSEYNTGEGLLMGESDTLRALAWIAGAPEEFDDKQRYMTLYETYMHGPGHRQPNISSSNRAQFIRNVSYNSVARSGEMGRANHWDMIDYYMRPGPQTATIGTPGVAEESGWPLLLLGGGTQSLIRNGFSDSTWLANNTSADDIEAGQLAALATPDTASWYLYGIRGPQNDYAIGMDSIDLYRGPTRVTACGDGHIWYHLEHTSGPTYCEVDGDSLPLDATNDSLMRQYARWTRLDSAAPSADAEPWPTEEFTDTAVAKVIRFAGNSRYLACSGQWQFRADTVATRWRQEWIDSTDAGGSHYGGGVDTGTRSWGVDAGTACADTDDDGLPNEYEAANSADSVSLAIDSMSYNRPAFEWFLDGRNLDATLVGCEDLACAAEATTIAATFGAVDRYVYIVPNVSKFGLMMPDYTLGDIRFAVFNPAGDTALVVACTASTAPADSASVHNRVQAWDKPGLNTAVLIRDLMPFAGIEC